MERAEKQGLAVAAVGHLALFALLSLGLLSARIPKPPLADTMDVTIADMAGLQSAAPKVSATAPKASEAPEQGRPEESAPPPPAPEPTPPPPEPKPPVPEPKPTPPAPKPAPPKPEKPEPKPEKKAEPKPEKPKPDKPKPDKPKPEKPTPAKPTREKPKPEKPAPEKPARPTPEKSAPAKSTAKTSTSKKAPGLPSDFLKDLPTDTGSGKTKGADKPKGSRLGKDFLKGLGSDAAGKTDAPRAAAVSARSMAGIGSLIREQVKPNYNPPTGGADAASIVSTLEITMSRDGTVQNVAVVGHKGVNGTNSAYVRQADDAAIRAVRRSSPMHLPPDLYDGGWQSITLNFSGAQLQ